MGQRGESERETKREEMKRKMKRIGVRDAKGFSMKDNLSRLSVLSLYFFSPGVVFATSSPGENPRPLPLSFVVMGDLN